MTGVTDSSAARHTSELIRRAREQAFENLFDAVVVTDMEGRIVDWNAGSERLYGYAREEALGRSVDILHLPEERDRVLGMVLEAVARHGRWQGEVGLLRKDGSRGWIESSVVPVLDDEGRQVGALGINRDISSRKEASQELQAAEERFRTLVEQSLVGIHILRDGRFVYANPKFLEIFGYTMEELKSAHVLDLVVPADRERLWQNVERRIEGEELEEHYSFEALRRDGETIHAQVHGARIELEGEPAVLGMLLDVTEQRRAQEQLEASEARYRLIAQASADVFRDWAVATGILDWGGGPGALFHYRPEEMGETVDWWSSRIHPDDRTHVLEELYSVLNGAGDTWSGEYRFRRGDGAYAVILDRARIVRSPNGEALRMMSSMQDVTVRRRSEEAQRFLARASSVLDDSLDRNAILTRLARLAVPFLADCCLIDVVARNVGRIERAAVAHVDPHLEDLLAGESLSLEDDARGDPILGVLTTGEALLAPDLEASPASGLGTDGTGCRSLRDAGLRSLMVVPLLTRGEVVGSIAVGVSAARRPYTTVDLDILEDLARRAAQTLDNALLYEDAQRATESRSRLFADLSHEFRTPLTLALAPLDDLLDGRHGPMEEAQKESIRVARRNARRVLELVNEILDLARAEAGRLPHHPRLLDLAALVADALPAFEPLARRRSVRLESDLPPGPVEVVADPEHLGKVLSNLLSNALKFTPAGGRAEIALEADETRAQVRVSDTGPGIPADERPHVFDRFHRGAARGPGQSGSGIGLALTRQLVELQGGSLELESEEGCGSTFRFTLPVSRGVSGTATAADPAEATPAAEGSHAGVRPRVPGELEHGGESTDGQVGGIGRKGEDGEAGEFPPDEDRTTVLVVEDDADLRAYLRSHLAREYRVLEAPDGLRGLEMVRSALPDLVLSDVMMSGMSGYELCRAIRQDPETDFIPVILITGRAALEDRMTGLQARADDYVTKPFHAEELLARVRNLIRSRMRLRERLAEPVLTLHPRAPDIASADARFLDRVREVVEENLDDETYTVERMARDLAHSRGHLHRRLTELLDEAPSDLLRRMRLERGAQLLEAGAGSVSSIAYAVGFKSVSHFSDRFLDRYGVRPSAWAGSVRT